MAVIVANGTVTLTTGGNNFAYVKIKVGGLTPDDQILATARPGKKGMPPMNLGPLFVPFVERLDPDKPGPPANEFGLLIYDIQAGAHPVDILVDYAVIRT